MKLAYDLPQTTQGVRYWCITTSLFAGDRTVVTGTVVTWTVVTRTVVTGTVVTPFL